MKKLFLLCIIATIYVKSFSQTIPEEIVKNFFTIYPSNPDAAIDTIFATSKWSAKIKDEINEIKKDLHKYTPEYIGEYYGYAQIVKKELAGSFMLLSYMVKYDREPERFTFEFYKPNDKWFIYYFKIDTKIDDEIEEAAKISNDNLDSLR